MKKIIKDADLLIGETIKVNRVVFKNRRTTEHYIEEQDAVVYKILKPEKNEKRYEVFFHYKDGSLGFSKISKLQIIELINKIQNGNS